jgi:hypothetical protein
VVGGSAVGAATLLRGAWLKTLAPKAIEAGKAPTNLTSMVESGSGLQLTVHGLAAAGQFGYGVALVPSFETDGRAAILVGAPNGATGGTQLSGGAELLRWQKTGKNPGLAPWPWLAIAGESPRPGSRFGQSLSAASQKGQSVFAVGAWLATPHKSEQLDQGAVYADRLPSP